MLSVDELKELGFDEKGIKEYYEYIKGKTDFEIWETDMDIKDWANPNYLSDIKKKSKEERDDTIMGCLIQFLFAPIIFAIFVWIFILICKII